MDITENRTFDISLTQEEVFAMAAELRQFADEGLYGNLCRFLNDAFNCVISGNDIKLRVNTETLGKLSGDLMTIRARSANARDFQPVVDHEAISNLYALSVSVCNILRK